MSEGMGYIDILFFAAVAAFIAYRLRHVLGRKTGQERRRPTPVVTQRTAEAHVEPAREPIGPVVTAPVEPKVADPADPALKNGLTRLRLADRSFDLQQFLEGARGAFAMIVEAFSKGEKAALKPLLAPDVYASFAVAIDEREAAGNTLATHLVAVNAAELAGAIVNGTRARLTVRFVTEQINVTRAADGTVVDGDPEAVHEVVDLWSFERDTRAKDPNWTLVETRAPEA